MKNTLVIIAFLISVYNLKAQRVVEEQIAVKPTATIALKLDFADSILIKQSKDDNIRIKAIVSINNNQHNDKYELIVSESNDFIKVKAKINDMESIRIPCNDHRGTNYSYSNGNCLTMDIIYEIEIPTIANLSIETISGDITIDNPNSPMDVRSISGYIDLSINPKTNSNIKVETVTGGVYTNHEFNKDSDHCDSNPGGTDASFKIGSGGNRIKLETVSGDVFIRKI